jgi:hypothetical protein
MATPSGYQYPPLDEARFFVLRKLSMPFQMTLSTGSEEISGGA